MGKLVAAILLAFALAPGSARVDLSDTLRRVAAGAPGTLGVRVVHVERGVARGVSEDDRFPMMSVYKLPTDTGIVRLRDGSHLVIVALMKGAKGPEGERDAVLAQVARVAYEWAVAR